MSRMRRFYGAQPLHLMASVISFAIVAAGVAGWFQTGSDPRGTILWALGSAVAFEWLVLPLAYALDWLALTDRRTELPAHTISPPRATAFIRIPVMLSALLLLVFSPLIFRLDTGSFVDTTGTAPADYLVRWLLATAAMFAISAVWYALTLRRHADEPAPAADRSALS